MQVLTKKNYLITKTNVNTHPSHATIYRHEKTTPRLYTPISLR